MYMLRSRRSQPGIVIIIRDRETRVPEGQSVRVRAPPQKELIDGADTLPSVRVWGSDVQHTGMGVELPATHEARQHGFIRCPAREQVHPERPALDIAASTQQLLV